MDGLLLLHVGVAGVLVAGAGACAVWGIARGRKLQLGGPRTEDRWFTQLTALVQTLVFGTGLLGLVLLAGDGGGPDDPLHARVYGPFMVLAVVGAYSFRTADRAWNVRVFAVVSVFIFGLGVRAFYTG